MVFYENQRGRQGLVGHLRKSAASSAEHIADVPKHACPGAVLQTEPWSQLRRGPGPKSYSTRGQIQTECRSRSAGGDSCSLQETPPFGQNPGPHSDNPGPNQASSPCLFVYGTARKPDRPFALGICHGVFQEDIRIR